VVESAPATADARVAVPTEIEAKAPVVDPARVPVTATVPSPRPAPEPVRVAEPVPVLAAGSAPEPARDPSRAPDGDPYRPTCTQAQLRRFIKSRPWVPMHELRRRFGIYGGDDDVSPIRVGARTLFIGLPPAEGWMMGELLNAGDVGCELSLDPVTPVVIGVYPMRPVPRS
jgi:hypothetical protein